MHKRLRSNYCKYGEIVARSIMQLVCRDFNYRIIVIRVEHREILHDRMVIFDGSNLYLEDKNSY